MPHKVWAFFLRSLPEACKVRRIDYGIQGLDCSEEVAILGREVGGKPGIIILATWSVALPDTSKTATRLGTPVGRSIS